MFLVVAIILSVASLSCTHDILEHQHCAKKHTDYIATFV
jgi:hypothetical protein